MRSARLLSTLIVGALLGAGLGASSAAASDATLKAEIEAVVPQVTPAVASFAKTAKAAEKSGDVGDLKLATVKVRKAISLYKWSVINRKADTDGGLAAKKQLLVAIREYDIGFAAYANALDKVTAGASKASTIASLKSFAKRITEASKDEAAALDALGVVIPPPA